MTETEARKLWTTTISKDKDWSARLLDWYATEYPKYLARKAKS